MRNQWKKQSKIQRQKRNLIAGLKMDYQIRTMRMKS
ncbi:unnamed protein product [Paramecium sonneborni]|uniref:Uncharacterized protein n=1 Tax=Paramecium sonneborni TaxID=65129 RepID=A0A8S1PG18_9CILI|nr:unnamed protein product [Paramecium sonneborni]